MVPGLDVRIVDDWDPGARRQVWLVGCLALCEGEQRGWRATDDPPGRVGPDRGSETLKLVIGIVRPEKANDVLEALYRAHIRGFSLMRVQGHGGESERVETYRGTTVKMALADKVRFEVAVSDDFVRPAIDALCEGGRTGQVGDGKVFVIDLEQAVRIRTGEADVFAVTPVDDDAEATQ